MVLKVNFSGGMDTLFEGQKTIFIDIIDDYPSTIDTLIKTLKTKYLKGKPELFVEGSEGRTVRSGILILINDVDWEIEGGLQAPISDGDVVTFISTLHGG